MPISSPIVANRDLDRSSLNAVLRAPLTSSLTGKKGIESRTAEHLSKGRTSEQLLKGRRDKKELPKIIDQAAAAKGLGMELTDDGLGDCPMPGHGGDGHFTLGKDGELWFSCDCLGKTSRFPNDPSRAQYVRCLSDAYYSVISGTVLNQERSKLTGRLVWRLLLLEASGIVQPASVDMAELAEDADAVLHQARSLAEKLIGMRVALADDINEPPLPFPLSEKLLSEYCRLGSGVRPRSVLNGLIEARVLTRDGHANREEWSSSVSVLVSAGVFPGEP